MWHSSLGIFYLYPNFCGFWDLKYDLNVLVYDILSYMPPSPVNNTRSAPPHPVTRKTTTDYPPTSPVDKITPNTMFLCSYANCEDDGDLLSTVDQGLNEVTTSNVSGSPTIAGIVVLSVVGAVVAVIQY